MIEQQSDKYQQIYNKKSFKIGIDKLQHEFTCTVCLNTIQDCYVTRCGHVFCKACIQQAVNRHHRCPFCNQQLKQFKLDVFKNYHFNTIKKIFEQQKMKQAQKYLGKVFASDALRKIQEQNEVIEKLLGPIEKKIIENCQIAMLEYRKFTIGLFELQSKVEEKKALMGSKNIRDQSTIMKELQKIVINCLKKPIIAPQIIQLTTPIELMIPGNKIIKKNIKLSPLASYESLLPEIQAICSENNIRIQGAVSEQLTINGLNHKISDRLGLNAGTKLKIEGGVPFQMKIYCFTYNWYKQKTNDFFVCKDCGIKWVCENCSLHCHSGHEVTQQLKGHKPDWAICYCVTKSECKAINKNSMVE